jgi:hypothetical protein
MIHNISGHYLLSAPPLASSSFSLPRLCHGGLCDPCGDAGQTVSSLPSQAHNAQVSTAPADTERARRDTTLRGEDVSPDADTLADLHPSHHPSALF